MAHNPLLRVVLTCVLALMAAPAASEDAPAKVEDTYHEVTTPEGLTFRVPEDMPIEKRNGILAPIPFDEYIYGKFMRMDARVKKLEKSLGMIEERLAAIEKRNGSASLKSGAAL